MKRLSTGFLCSFGKQQLLKGCLPLRTSQALITRSFTQWDLVGAVCVERKPVITQELTPLEKKYLEYLRQVEVEKSYLSDHEMKHKKDVKNVEKMKAGELDDLDAISKQTAQDFEDACLAQYNKFKPAPRITEADLNNNQKSLERKLDHTLLLVVKQKIGNDYRWVLPQGIHGDGETLRQAAERVLKETCGSKLKAQFMGNAPVGYYKYKYPKVVRGNGICGAKVFFLKAQVMKGEVCEETILNNPNIDDFLWLTRPELKGMLQPVYLRAVESFLIPDQVPETVEESDHDFRDQRTAVH